MQYLAGIVVAVLVGLIMGNFVGYGLLPMAVAFGLGLMAYGLVDMRIKKRNDGGNRSDDSIRHQFGKRSSSSWPVFSCSRASGSGRCRSAAARSCSISSA